MPDEVSDESPEEVGENTSSTNRGCNGPCRPWKNKSARLTPFNWRKSNQRDEPRSRWNHSGTRRDECTVGITGPSDSNNAFKEKPPFESPGIIFLDTPGHESFGSIRSRSGSVADIAILIVDIVEGFKPQTIQSIQLLEQNNIPFIIVGNKIDRIHHWESKRGRSSWQSWDEQTKDVKETADEHYYKLLGQVATHSRFNLANIGKEIKAFDIENDRLFVPMSAKEG